MSSETLPINLNAFAEAIKELPLSAVYNKVLELRNSIAHLHRSNAELRLFLLESQEPEEEKQDIRAYVTENEGVIESMNERISLLKIEMENRGQPWVEAEEKDSGQNGESHESSAEADAPAINGTSASNGANQDQTSGAGQEGEDGIYL